MSLIIAHIELVIRGAPLRLCFVTLFLQTCEDVQVHIKHIRLWPYLTTISLRVFAVVAAIGRQLQRYLIFVVVVLIVITHADENSQLVILQVGGIRYEMVGMNEHLHPAILTQVEGGFTIDGLRLPTLQILDHHVECLLIILYELGL